MKLRRISMMAAAGVMAAGALLGATGAGTASASSLPYLCVDGGAQGNRCIFEEGNGSPAALEVRSVLSGDLTQLWGFPAAGGTGEMESRSGYCLQLNASGGDTVRTVPCIGDLAEYWTNEYDSAAKRTIFISAYDPNLCLSADYNDGIIKADTCVDAWYQEWGSS
jgi:hypothetical protein